MKLRLLTALLAGGGLCLTSVAGPLSELPTTGSPPSEPQDTSKIYLLDEIVTTATRLEAANRTLPSALTPLDRKEIDARPGSLLTSALTGVPGLFVRSYGGGNALQTVSLRGMAPEQTLLLIDGQRVNSFQNGQADLGFLPSANIERVEVVKGGYSSLYGASAVGGVISVTTKRPPERLSGSLTQTFGSYGFQGTELTLGSSAGGFGWQADVRKERGAENYEFEFADGSSSTAMRRVGNDFQNATAQGRLEWRSERGNSVFLNAFVQNADRGVATAVTDPSTVSRARLANTNFRGTLGTRWDLGSSFEFRFTGSGTYASESYADPTILVNGVPLKSDGTNRLVVLTPEVRYNGSTAFRGTVGADLGYAWYRGSDLLNADRRYGAVFVSTQHSFALGTDAPFDFHLYPSLRYDRFSDVEGDLSPRIGVNLGLLRIPEIRLRSSYGKNFRVPTFNDLYWIAGGNPDLKPERSLSFDAGVLARVEWNGQWSLDGSFFDIRAKDRIVWTPTSGSFWSPKNIGEVESKGVELEGSWKGLDGLLTVTGNSTWIDARKTSEDFSGDPTVGKKLIYVPGQTVSLSATVDIAGFTIFAENLWVSYRYTTETNDRFLPSYSVTSAAVGYGIPLGDLTIRLKAEATNIFNTQYQILALYPMPMREVRVTAGVEL